VGVIVAFNYDNWVQLFPQFAYLSSAQVQLYWSLAQQVHRNDGGGPVQDATTQTNLLNLATAHIVQLFAPPSTGGSSPGRDPSVVGRITSASEGSVSVSTDMPVTPSSAWWMQTQWGAAYWQFTAPFRTMRYIAATPKPANPWPIFGGWGPGGWGGR
jgi:hypothetical protein